MNTKLPIVLGLIIAVMSGCISSLNPLYTDKDIIFKNELIGTWTDAKTGESWSFEKLKENGYTLVRKEEGAQSTFRAVLVKIGDYTFLDLYPDESTANASLVKKNLLPVHTFSKVTVEGENLTLEMLDSEWVEKGIATETIQVQHTKTAEGYLVLTAPTQELQAFMSATAANKEAFGEAVNLSKR